MDKVIVSMIFGSHMYDTATPTSDMDIKNIYLPDARDIVLLKARNNVHFGRDKKVGERNTAEDTDIEAIALHRYLQLLAEGQTMALDMLFAPNSAMKITPDEIWQDIKLNQHKILNKKAASFVGYCRQQANKYGIRGSRVHAVRSVVEFLEATSEHYGLTTKLFEIEDELINLQADGFLEHTAIVAIDQPNRDKPLLHLECCDRKVPFNATVKIALDIYRRVLNEYGHRALAAEQNQGVDWKALSHAVRVGR